MEPVYCHFYDSVNKVSRAPGVKCAEMATGFVRIKHTGRLCPLCDGCKQTFVNASKAMSEEIRKTVPGGGEYDEVSLESGREEFANQPPRS